MNADWKKLERDLEALKLFAATMREKSDELAASEIEGMLAPLRGCMVEMIALRSMLERARQKRHKTSP